MSRAHACPRACRQALEHLQGTIARVRDLGELHTFLFVEHGAYAAPKQPVPTETSSKGADSALAGTY